ncbi:hypothetical protein SISSUDRAFT_1053128, partial [Sistotremastrum suecicum HHB10207 ss-3]
MIPKHVSNIPISTSFGVPTHAAVPGGRWFLYYALEGIKFLDTAKVPIQDGILLTEDSNPPDIFGTIGGGVVRCGTTSYDATPNNLGYAICLRRYNIYFPAMIEEHDQRPYIQSMGDTIHRTGSDGDYKDPYFLVIHSEGAENVRTSLRVFESESRVGVELEFEGHDYVWYQILRAEFHATLQKIILDVAYETPEEDDEDQEDDDEEQRATWVIDIPSVPTSQCTKVSPNNGAGSLGFEWRKSTVNVANVRYFRPTHWTTNFPAGNKVPASFTCIKEYAVPSGDLADRLVFLALCLTPDGSFEHIPLGRLGPRWAFQQGSDGREIGYSWLADDFLDVCFTRSPERQLVQARLQLPAGQRPWALSMSKFRSWDPIYAQLVVEREADPDPSIPRGSRVTFVIQY